MTILLAERYESITVQPIPIMSNFIDTGIDPRKTNFQLKHLHQKILLKIQ